MSTNGDYVLVTFSNVQQDETDMLIATLSVVGYEGFEETEDVLKAYISKTDFDKMRLADIAAPFFVSYQSEEIASQNWNELWESNFEPVVIDDFVAVRAHFHEPVSSVEHDIVITPKMSFGTGHHATTTMMIQQMRNLNFKGKDVLDFGTGTGILSILAEKLGAAFVLAIDNDEWSIENSKENIARNECNNIAIELRENADTAKPYDIILANINRNVILDNLPFLFMQLKPKGFLLLSGLLTEDENFILDEVNRYLLVYINTINRLQWISLLLSR